MVLLYEDKMKYYYLINFLILLFICNKLWANEDLSPDFQQILQKTEAQTVQAQQAKGLWRDTQQLIKQAKELASAGMHTKAITLLHEAQHQAQLGYQQALDQADKELVPAYLRP